MNEITIILVIKNRLEEPTRKCIDSLLLQTQSCDIIVVDYGSSEENLKWEREVFSKVRLIEVKRDTRIFNKCRALNIGIKASTTPFILQTDIDLIFSPNFVEEVLKILKSNEKVLVLSQRIDLSQDGSRIIKISKTAHGSCIGISAKWLKSVHGYDEHFIEWGGEDDDIIWRARMSGFQVRVLTPKKTTLRHQWHPLTDRRSRDKNIRYLQAFRKITIRNSDGWGNK